MDTQPPTKAIKAWTVIDPPTFHDTMQYSDARIVGSDGEVSAHKLVLGAASPLLRRCLEDVQHESDVAVLCLPDFPVSQLRHFLEVLYGKRRELADGLHLGDMFRVCGVAERPYTSRAKVKIELPEHEDIGGEADVDFDGRNIEEMISSNEDSTDTEVLSLKRRRGRRTKTSAVKCDKIFKSPACLETHVEQKHSQQRDACPVCEKSMVSSFIARHIALAHRPKAHECLDCEQMCAGGDADLQHHIDTVHAADHHAFRRCAFCGKKAGSDDRVARHEKVCKPKKITRPRVHKNRRKNGENYLAQIKVPFLEDRPDACPHEGCEFRHSKRCKIRMHYLTKHCRQKCPFCEQILGVNSIERHVIMRHTKQYRFVCELCSKGFFKESDLSHHLADEHVKELRHICDHCGKGFYSSLRLNTHKYRAHKNNSWPCTPCGKNYTSQCALVKHIKRHHNSEGLDAIYRNSKGEFRQVRNFKHTSGGLNKVKVLDDGALKAHLSLDPKTE